MGPTNEEWIARSAAAFCGASRWLSCTSLVLAALALLRFYVSPPMSMTSAAVLSAAVAAASGQAYLAVRIEFDRKVFEALAVSAGGVAAATAGFDRAMESLDMLRHGKSGRPLAERARGALRLVKGAGWLLALQLALAIAMSWMP
jgi:hypothetical protein